MTEGAQQSWARPVPVIGDATSARTRREDPAGWAMGAPVVEALEAVVGARRDIRRFRPDPVPDELLEAVLAAGHRAPSVGHSQPWRFIVVSDQSTRDRAAHLADAARLAQADHLTEDRAARLLDLKLEGLREAPLGIVVACDRRTPAMGVLGRATFPDADLWSCATAIENMWLTARAHGLQVMLGCMVETSLGITASAHLAPLVDWADLDGNLTVTNDPFIGVEVAPGGRLILPDGPGLGVSQRPG